jgi:hypothetical protein
MTLSYSDAKQKLVPPVTSGSFITGSHVQSLLNGQQSQYRFANKVIYFEDRDQLLVGERYGNAPWYTDPRDTDNRWISRIVKLPFYVDSPLPNSNISSVDSAPTNPVASGTPAIGIYVKGINLQVVVKIQRVTVDPVTFAITYGNSSTWRKLIAGTFDTIDPPSSIWDEVQEFIGLPEDTVPGDLLLLDFIYRSDDEVSDTDFGYLNSIVAFFPSFTDFPDGSF